MNSWPTLASFFPTRLTALALLILPLTIATAADFNVSAAGSTSYIINGQADPALTLTRGRTYSFAIAAAGHPFFIKTVAVTGSGSAYNNGVVGNGVQVGSLVFTVPNDAPNTLFYICSLHFEMRGTLNIVDPPPPPTVNIVSITVANNITVISTGASGWTVTPEFATSLSNPIWSPVSTFQTALENGTNTTTFDKIENPGAPLIIRIRLDEE